jgi:hypothetical protein
MSCIKKGGFVLGLFWKEVVFNGAGGCRSWPFSWRLMRFSRFNLDFHSKDK